MKLKNLIDKYSDNQIIETIVKLYPSQKKSKKRYKVVLKELRNKRAVKTRLNILLTKVKDEDVHVHGIDENKEAWAIEYISWGKWINMEIESKSYKKYKKLEIIARCLWEMTWGGWSDEKVKKSSNELFKRAI